MLTIYVDFKCPGSCLALEPVLSLIADTGVEARWLPFSTRPFTVPADKPYETVGERHRRVRAIARRDVHLHYAGVQGRTMHFAERPHGSDTALAALAAIEGDPVPFIHAAFTAYWEEGADLDNPGVVASLCAKCDLETPDFGGGAEKRDTIRDNALDLGVFDTPSFMIADQLFLGREHLPWIRSLIEQR